MKKLFIALSAALFLGGNVQAQDDLVAKVRSQSQDTEKKGYEFTTQVDLSVLPVKNQASSGTCWSYATTSFIESEMARIGRKPVDISEMFTARMVYHDKAIRYVRLEGHLNFAQGGALPDVLYVMKKYGAMPYTSYRGLEYGEDVNRHSELEKVLKGMLDAIITNPNGRLSTSWQTAFDAVLDAYFGAVPEKFDFEGKNYTPRSFADKVVGLNPDDYVQITSFLHAPFYEEMFIEVPDNWSWGTSYNLPLDELMENVNNALDKGFTLSWATDVSEKGFSARNGLAIVPAIPYNNMTADQRREMFERPVEERTITPEIRQAAFDNFETTDDHGMHIVGRVVDQNGTRYYVVKNSWGEIPNPYKDGYIFCSETFLRYKTISFVVHKDALTKKTRKSLGL
ncbi:MAG: aminopeptidase [Flavobacteriales bacterium]|nr:MAG: aminopeptidase [Flavobacteriales bacterium]